MADSSVEDQWSLVPVQLDLVMTRKQANRLGFAILLTFFVNMDGSRATRPKSRRKESSRCWGSAT